MRNYENKFSSTRRWLSFTLERFPPLRHLLLISFLFEANALIVVQTTRLPLGIPPLSFVVVLIAFFRLRLFDEIKDYETDREVNPQRPLARGLIALHEAKKVAFSLLFIELLLSLIIGPAALIAACSYALYSLLMYKEFFVGNWLRQKLATYALTHTVVSGLIALFIFSAITDLYFWMAPLGFLFFAIANWMIFNVFEFGRKTFGKEEEQQGVDSYSKNFGSWGAISSVLFMALTAVTIALALGQPLLITVLLVALFAFLLVCSLIYGSLNTKRSAILFRMSCTTFILFYNLILSTGFLL